MAGPACWIWVQASCSERTSASRRRSCSRTGAWVGSDLSACSKVGHAVSRLSIFELCHPGGTVVLSRPTSGMVTAG